MTVGFFRPHIIRCTLFRTRNQILYAVKEVVLLPFVFRPNTSLLYTSSMLWSQGCQNIEEYYYKSIGVPLQLLPTVLGLKLAVDLDLGSKYAIVILKAFSGTLCLLCMAKAVRLFMSRVLFEDYLGNFVVFLGITLKKPSF